jgi:hypothetical protein
VSWLNPPREADIEPFSSDGNAAARIIVSSIFGFHTRSKIFQQLKKCIQMSSTSVRNADMRFFWEIAFACVLSADFLFCRPVLFGRAQHFLLLDASNLQAASFRFRKRY